MSSHGSIDYLSTDKGLESGWTRVDQREEDYGSDSLLYDTPTEVVKDERKCSEKFAEKWNKLSPRQKTAVKVMVTFLVLAALLGGGLLAMHYTVGIQAGFQAAGHWMSGTALPAIKAFLAHNLTVKNALIYLGLPALGGVVGTVILVKGIQHFRKKRKENKSQYQFGKIERREEKCSGLKALVGKMSCRKSERQTFFLTEDLDSSELLK